MDLDADSREGDHAIKSPCFRTASLDAVKHTVRSTSEGPVQCVSNRARAGQRAEDSAEEADRSLRADSSDAEHDLSWSR